ncbi:kinase-like domain-containing protein [Russula earlei]|uniref:Kinase-like domain-containing protein n=1 Tax=Russula earlei TaxID=71964 RepID=A0ACC0U9I4_9AGAM|nr:kinase-like domain-containing protein [Russula earlei]
MNSYLASASQLLGQTIDNGALKIEAILGAGSFGVVYRAVDTQSGARFAVKRIEKVPSDYYQTRETQLHARVSSHPHVLTFHDEIDAGDHAFFVYDLCAGDLRSVIGTFFREDELIKRVFIQIIDALEHCHSRGVYHRDLKPENILVSSQSGEMDVFVADFGLATTNKVTASSCGTPCYMSPESLVRQHKPYSTVEGDIWSLGCILTEMIANRCPWRSASPDDRDYNDYLVDRAVLLDVLPVSDAAYSLLKKIFSPIPERRPSLAEIRMEVLAVDTFFLTDKEAARFGCPEKKLQRKSVMCGIPSVSPSPSDETSASCYSCTSRYSCGSSSSAFESISLESSGLPITPPTPAVEVFYSLIKAAGELGLRTDAAQTA